MRKTLIVFAFVLLCSSFAGAQSSESVCDGEQGAAYGLCNAFCDAMDCDSDDPQASETACNKVKSKFQQVTGNEPPCLQPQLSCVCTETLPRFLDVASLPIDFCFLGSNSVSLLTEGFGSVSSESFQAFGACSVATPAGEFGLLNITVEEALACNDFLLGLAAAAGVSCQ